MGSNADLVKMFIKAVILPFTSIFSSSINSEWGINKKMKNLTMTQPFN